MAEAHQAVAFQFAVTDEGIHVHFDKEAVKLALRSFFVIYKYRYAKIRNAVLKGVFPASPISLLVLLALVFGLYWTGHDPSCGVVTTLAKLSRWLGYYGGLVTWIVLAMEALFLWIMLSYVQRYTLKALLVYKGYMYDPRGKPSLTTKVWLILVRLVAAPFSPGLYSYQNALPRLPVPALSDTCSRYLDSVRPLLNDKKFVEMQALVEDFKNGPGKKMQRYLYLKSWWATNYVTDWWEQYVYLHGRSSLMINSNYYACDQLRDHLTTIPAARAGLVAYMCFKLKKEIESERLMPLIFQNAIPLCSAQYERLFGTTRIPGLEADKLMHYAGEESNYIVCCNHGRWYKVDLSRGKRALTPAELEVQFQAVLDDDTSPVGPGEEHLCALTAHDRKSWAETREMHFSSGVNKQSLEIIDKAALVFFFDDKKPVTCNEGDNCEGLTAYCRDLLHGNGYDKWFDKSLTMVFYANGKLGITAEHSWADAPIIGFVLEYSCLLEAKIGYRPDGHCTGAIRGAPIKPQRLEWDIKPLAVSRIEEALTFAKKQIADLDLYVLEHGAFGKGDIKKCSLSPDAFIQMAIQLAYYKDAGEKFCLTYEASMTRLFREGRTETVRPVTMESTNFVKAMCNPNTTNEECKRLLYIAAERHALGYKKAMTGEGIDRHLFCLYVMSKYLKIDSPFLTKVLEEPWRLSTSQTPTQQTGKLDLSKEHSKRSAGGGFGPVAKDGYGVSYIIQGNDVMFFHVSSFVSCPETNSRRFAKNIEESLAQMRGLFLDRFQ